ncbi:MAG: ABC transporter substrate-binding protein [Deltaproteobacteria bacterium]|nr:MAG: ABC transporter substrate-binding protein [Deltaproteobacteria bacterium]
MTIILAGMALWPENLYPQSAKVLVSAPAKSLTWFPAFFAKEKGFYKDEGLDVDFVVMGPQLALQALVTGDVGYTTALGSTMRGAVRGLPIRVVLTICEKPHFALIARPGINSVAALKGKVLGVSPCSICTSSRRARMSKSSPSAAAPTASLLSRPASSTRRSWSFPTI